ncbi:MAG: hypothetical protein EOL93_01720 [Epsilonproteobacteria bacterium]|nr:hypothetical protein [Campylobacterota bacterium]
MARIYGADINIIYRALLKTKPGMMLTYAYMSKLVDRDIATSGDYILQSARTRAKVEKGVLFRAVNKMGLERLTDHGMIKASRTYVVSAHRQAKSAIETLGCVKNFEKLSEQDKNMHNASITLAKAVCYFCDPKCLDMIDEMVSIKGRALSLSEIKIAS